MEKLQKCLSCLDLEQFEVIVVDNASMDGSVEMVREEFPRVKLITSDRNVGFGRANNLGISQANGSLYLFLNSDAYVQGNALELMVEQFFDEKIVAAGPKLLNLDGSLQESVAGQLTLWNVFLEQTYLDAIARKLGMGYWQTRRLPKDSVSEVHQVMGACLMVRAFVGEKFDERFFLYCEDTDLCRRLESHGKIIYIPQAEVIHELGSSSVDSRWKSVARYNAGKELYFKIHFGNLASMACWILNRFGAFLRVLTGIIKPEKAKIFWKVLLARRSEINPL